LTRAQGQSSKIGSGLSSGLSSPRRHERRKKPLARIPLGRLTTPAEIADLAVFFAFERASFIIGTVIPVDGGF
jgi:3-oxoacyl-[acyl-carrier protein] reductase